MKSIHDDIKAALAQAADGEPQPDFSGDGDDIIDLAIKEAGRRLTDDPASFGETALVNLVKEANKAAERREEKARREAEQNQKQRDVLDIVRSSSLPEDRKRELIEQEVARLRALIIELEEHLNE